MNSWVTQKLGDLIVLHYGKSLKAENRIEGLIPVFSSAGVTGYHNEALVEGPGIIVGRKGSVGTVYLSQDSFYCIDTAYYIKPNNEKYDFLYLFYLLKTLGLTELNEDSAVPGLNRQTAYDQIVNIPPLPEQQAIASVLSALDDKIDLLQRQNQTLEQMAATLFRQWFIEEAKEDWEEVTIGDIFTLKGGSTPSTKESSFWDGNISWTSPKDLSNSKSIFMFDTERKITEAGLAKISSGLLPVRTLLMSSRAPIGYLAMTDIEVAINQGYIAIPEHQTYSTEFMYLWCQLNMDTIENAGNGSVFQEISKSSFRDLIFVIPDENTLNRFDAFVKPTFTKIKSNTQQIRTLQSMRDTLLPKLISGEVRLKGFETLSEA